MSINIDLWKYLHLIITSSYYVLTKMSSYLIHVFTMTYYALYSLIPYSIHTREWSNHWKSCFFCNSMWHFICSAWEVFQVSAERNKYNFNICQMISLHLLKLEGVCFTDVNILLISTNKDLTAYTMECCTNKKYHNNRFNWNTDLHCRTCLFIYFTHKI